MAPQNVDLTPALRDEYRQLFESCAIIPAKEDVVNAAVKKIRNNEARYKAVEAATGVPWQVVAAIHSLEASCDFDRHLHNGDPLTSRTVHVPKNRPTTGAPPFTWEASAIDALQFDGFSKWNDWSIAGTLYMLERYNGLGYRLYHHKETKSPYLWSFTNHYEIGKYGADGKFDPNLISQQVGASALLKMLGDVAAESSTRAPMGSASGREAPPYPGRYIRQRERDRQLVLSIQARLVEVGCGPIEIDGDFGPDTFAAVKQLQSRSVSRRGSPLGIDGVIGPDTWEALFGRSTVVSVDAEEQTDSLLRKAVDVAVHQIGVLEDPPYSNSGERVMSYLASVGMNRPAPWCAAFVYWCFEQAARELGVDNPLVKTAGCLDHWNRASGAGARRITAADATEDTSLLRPGQIFIMDHGGGLGHTGIIEHVEGSYLVTVEGNTGPDGSREGLGVFERSQRRISSINVGFLDYASVTQRPAIVPAATLTDVAQLRLDASAAGLLLGAVQTRNFEEPTRVEIEFSGLRVMVGAHALRARVGGRLLRLPVSYVEALEISRILGWVPPTYALSDQIWNSATLHIPPHTSGEFDPDATQQERDARLRTLRYVVAHDELIEQRIQRSMRGALASTEGKDWVLSRRNLTAPHKATTYGWHNMDGSCIQKRGDDSEPPLHNDEHVDYSQTLRPIRRMARRKSDGSVVDLLAFFEDRGLPAAVLAPLRG